MSIDPGTVIASAAPPEATVALIEHRTGVTRWGAYLTPSWPAPSGRPRYTATCVCGWSGGDRTTARAAEADATAHLSTAVVTTG